MNQQSEGRTIFSRQVSSGNHALYRGNGGFRIGWLSRESNGKWKLIADAVLLNSRMTTVHLTKTAAIRFLSAALSKTGTPK